MPLPSHVTFDQYDAGTDDPRLARAQLATLADSFNDLLDFLGLSTITGTPLTVGDGLEGAAGALRAKLDGATLLRSAAGLKVATGGGANQIPILDGSGKFQTGVFACTLDAQQQVLLSGTLTPAAPLAANTNDYNPAGLATAVTLQISASTPIDLTGIQGGVDGRVLVLDNVGANLITLKDASTSSSAANRFSFGADYPLAAGQQLALRYRGSASRWVMFTKAAAAVTAAVKYLSTASNTALDSTYRNGLVDLTGSCTITLPTLPDDSDNRGWRVTLRNISTTDADDGFAAPPTGQAIDALPNNTTRKFWPGTEITLVWVGGNKWSATSRGEWIPVDRAIATLGTETNLDVSLAAIPVHAREALVVCSQAQVGTGTSDWALRFSVDGGATFASDATYKWGGAIQNTAGGSAVFASGGTAQWTFSYNNMTNVALTTACKAHARTYIERPKAAIMHALQTKAVYPTGATAVERTDYAGNYGGSAHSIDAIRLFGVTAARPWQIGSTMEVYWR